MKIPHFFNPSINSNYNLFVSLKDCGSLQESQRNCFHSKASPKSLVPSSPSGVIRSIRANKTTAIEFLDELSGI